MTDTTADIMTYEQREELKMLWRWGVSKGLPGYKGRCPSTINLMRNDFEVCELAGGHDDDHYNKSVGHWHVSS